jgi:hypothetical protein
MNKLRYIAVIAILMMSGVSFVSGQSAIQSASAGAKIQQSIAITEVSPMHFGTMTVKAGQGGTCVITTSGLRQKTGGVTLTNLLPQYSLATYSVTGEAGRTYSITLPNSITVSYLGFTMIVNNLLAKAATGVQSQNATGTLGTGGTDQFTVGATLNVAAGQEEGLYSGSFQITVAYN